MKKTLILLILSSLAAFLFSQNLSFKLDTSMALYYAEYNSYSWDEPLTGLHLNAEVYNLSGKFGIGASGFYSISSSDDHFDLIQIYDGYIHYFTALSNENKYFVYGFYGGVRYVKLEYNPRNTFLEEKEEFLKPLIGFKFADELWGFNVTWSQADDRKPILGYEVKFRGSSGWIMKLGRRNRGFIGDVDSDVFFHFGYEFFK